MAEPVAPCRDLYAIARVYPDDKRVTVQVPITAFNAEPIETDYAVTIVGTVDRQGKPIKNTPKAKGRVKRILAEVEVDLATLDSAQHPGQRTLA